VASVLGVAPARVTMLTWSANTAKNMAYPEFTISNQPPYALITATQAMYNFTDQMLRFRGGPERADPSPYPNQVATSHLFQFLADCTFLDTTDPTGVKVAQAGYALCPKGDPDVVINPDGTTSNTTKQDPTCAEGQTLIKGICSPLTADDVRIQFTVQTSSLVSFPLEKDAGVALFLGNLRTTGDASRIYIYKVTGGDGDVPAGQYEYWVIVDVKASGSVSSATMAASLMKNAKTWTPDTNGGFKVTSSKTITLADEPWKQQNTSGTSSVVPCFFAVLAGVLALLF